MIGRAIGIALSLAACRAPAVDAPSNSATIREGLVVPTQLDPEVTPVTTASGADARHYYCTPVVPAHWNGQLVIYLVGAREDPATAHAFAERACGRGYAAIAPAYRNERAIRDLCEDAAACYGPVRHEIVYGEDAAPQLQVDRANGIVHRIDTLATHLAGALPAVWGPLRDRLARGDLTHVVLVGFSQGSGHALILAHDHEVSRVVLLSGVLDRVNTGSAAQGPVTWLAEFAASRPATPGARMFAINYADDPFTQPIELAANYAAIGLPDATCEVTEEPPTGECHRFVVHTEPCASRIDGHVTPSVASFGTASAPCALGGPLRHLGPTWDYLLSPH